WELRYLIINVAPEPKDLQEADQSRILLRQTLSRIPLSSSAIKTARAIHKPLS
uniref:Uncharacterized protein n=1 Tax=Aegilops tauschii subsp. strangulata TaxID=200361 RepID=A0A453FX17_AEGTS